MTSKNGKTYDSKLNTLEERAAELDKIMEQGRENERQNLIRHRYGT